jgi:hypothetical protein
VHGAEKLSGNAYLNLPPELNDRDLGSVHSICFIAAKGKDWRWCLPHIVLVGDDFFRVAAVDGGVADNGGVSGSLAPLMSAASTLAKAM